MLDTDMAGRAVATPVTGRTRRVVTPFDAGETIRGGTGRVSVRLLYVTAGVVEGDCASVDPITGVRRIPGIS
jgi:hypothetical protein